MKVIMINAVPYGSPAKIMYGIAECAKNNGTGVLTATGYSNHPAPETPENNVVISGFISKSLHMIASMITGRENYFSVLGTLKLIQVIKKNQPDIIHFHNMHGWYVNMPLLLRYIKKKKIKVVWTLHDCWAVTGHCTYFDVINCEKWKNECGHCALYKEYPMSIYDNSKIMHRIKKKWFTTIDNLSIVTPSIWLAEIVKKSYLSNAKISVINNGIDLNIYKPTKSDFIRNNNLDGKYIVLGVSIAWSIRKGIDIFIELARELDSRFQIILVGTDDAIDKQLPENIISIHKTNNQRELAEIYSSASIFVNPTREDNFPTVNIEALACGTPVITFKTGGSVEMIDDTCGIVVEQNDVKGLCSAITTVCTKKPFSMEDCIKKASHYNMEERFLEYIQLYEEILR